MIVGPSNKRAIDALKSPDRIVTLCGPTSTGKTFLAQALAREGDWLLDITSAECVDDSTADKIDRYHGRVVATLSMLPGKMGIPDRLVSRLVSGSLATLEEWTASMLQDLAAELATDMDAESVDALLSVARTPSEIVGAAKAWNAYGKQGLAPFIIVASPVKLACMDPQGIIDRTCELYRVSPTAVRGHRRTKTLAMPRHTAMYLIRKLTNLTLTDIGALFSDRDHSSVLHAIKRITRLVLDDLPYAGMVRDLERELTA